MLIGCEPMPKRGVFVFVVIFFVVVVVQIEHSDLPPGFPTDPAGVTMDALLMCINEDTPNAHSQLNPYQFNAQGGIIAVCLKCSPHPTDASAMKDFHAVTHALAQMRNKAKTNTTPRNDRSDRI